MSNEMWRKSSNWSLNCVILCYVTLFHLDAIFLPIGCGKQSILQTLVFKKKTMVFMDLTFITHHQLDLRIFFCFCFLHGFTETKLSGRMEIKTNRSRNRIKLSAHKLTKIRRYFWQSWRKQKKHSVPGIFPVFTLIRFIHSMHSMYNFMLQIILITWDISSLF